MVSKVCRCGKAFDTNKSVKTYCTPKCQTKFSREDSWDNTKLDYKARCRRLVSMAKNRSKTGGLFFNLTTDYLVKIWEDQEGRCVVSGRMFELSRPGETETVRANAPSVDRIIPSEGYVKGNIRLVCYQVNTALNEYGKEALISLCKDILEHNTGVIN